MGIIYGFTPHPNFLKKYINYEYNIYIMGNTMQKMRRSNSKVRRYLETEGYTDIQFFPHTRYSKDIHIGNLEFDGIARKDNTIVLFQVKSNEKPPTRKRDAMFSFNQQAKIKAKWFNVKDFYGVEEWPENLS